MNILIVDDNKQILDSLEEIIDEQRIANKVYKALSAKEALNIFCEKKIDVLIVDLNMPEVDGFELVKKINAIKTSSVQIIILSGEVTLGKVEKLLSDKVYTILSKPIPPKRITQLLEKIKDDYNSTAYFTGL